MNAPRARLAKAAPSLIAATAMLVAGCFQRYREPPAAEPTQAVHEVIGPPPSRGAADLPMSPTAALAEAPEPYVDLELSNAPVKLVLQRLAEIGGLQLIIPANLNKTISVQYVHVPVSVALKDVLRRSGLQLGSGPATNLPYDTVTVFYHLPANVDSMSAEAIVRRFGISRAMAELIVRSRPP